MPITKFIWDELSDNVMSETDENGSVIAEYDYRPEPFGELISQKRNGITSYSIELGELGRRTWRRTWGELGATHLEENLGGELGRRTWEENLGGELGGRTWGWGELGATHLI